MLQLTPFINGYVNDMCLLGFLLAIKKYVVVRDLAAGHAVLGLRIRQLLPEAQFWGWAAGRSHCS